MDYDIRVDLIPDLPEIGYRNGVGAWEGVCIHDTECANDSDESEVAYFKKNWRTRQAFVHAFVDGDSITQTAKWNYKCWGCGNGNSRYISLEMCSASSKEDFAQLYDRTIWLAASKLYELRLGVIDGKTLVSHNWVSKNLGGTTHTDPIAYLAKWGKTWADVVKDVKAKYDSFSTPIKPIVINVSPTTCNIAINEKVVAQGLMNDGKSYVPVRSIAEGFGAKVGWDASKGKALINGCIIDSSVTTNGVSYAWSAEVAKQLGIKLEWDNKTKTVYYSK